MATDPHRDAGGHHIDPRTAPTRSTPTADDPTSEVRPGDARLNGAQPGGAHLDGAQVDRTQLDDGFEALTRRLLGAPPSWAPSNRSWTPPSAW
ncbi:hypothetical protein [Actinosynnema pretiosum]|uniref:hypothetical protein n=1 Tax=Actinosynnema pretiosum TaxID=42197 RepID=UPI001E54DE8A|nr:hypothetical protein [Actinosynnema pretiosum]